ncbi:MAG: aldo/keto reductase [Armatimonadetes bacterium]|nr:aldo/keto reductase [Armatimonadota bacterium]
MKYTNLGRTGLSVSRLCLGTMNFGPETSEQDSFAIMDRAIELGINFFDTADVYGWQKGEGITEKIIGRWFALGGGRREKVVIATKFYGDMGDWPNQSRVNALYIRRACEASLRRLQTDFIDLYQMHHIWRDAPWEETWEAYENLVRQGKVVYTGSSNFGGWHIAKANEAAKKRNFLGLVCEQSQYSLLVRNIEMEVVPACADYGLGLIPWSPLAGGALAGPPAETGRRSGKNVLSTYEKNKPALEKWYGLCKTLNEEPADVALAWLLKQPVVTAPIIGPRSIAQLDNSLRALEISLDDATLTKIDEIFPGFKTSPEHYSW